MNDDIRQIIEITTTQNHRFGGCRGRVPDSAADILEEARLDRQLSFAHTLIDYENDFPAESAEAKTILGYVTLRSMCESTLKLFFSSYIEDYNSNDDEEVTKYATSKNGIIAPQDLRFVILISLFIKKKNKDEEYMKGLREFIPPVEKNQFNDFLERVRGRGNAIHHFEDRDIGSQGDLLRDITLYKQFLIDVDSSLPSPEDYLG